MRIRKTIAAFTLFTLSALSISDTISLRPVEAQPPVNYRNAGCRDFVTGAYLVRFSTTNGDVIARAVMTFTSDGNIFIVESAQNGIPGVVNPFGDAQGAWKCTCNRKITAKTLNFGYPGELGAANQTRTDFSVTFNPQTQTVQGTLAVRFFDFNVNPLTTDAPIVATFVLEGQRITVD